jgi:hypothetical protein
VRPSKPNQTKTKKNPTSFSLLNGKFLPRRREKKCENILRTLKDQFEGITTGDKEVAKLNVNFDMA